MSDEQRCEYCDRVVAPDEWFHWGVCEDCWDDDETDVARRRGEKMRRTRFICQVLETPLGPYSRCSEEVNAERKAIATRYQELTRVKSFEESSLMARAEWLTDYLERTS